jgi:N-acetylmuramoyl-L-alanine amidase
MNCQNTSRRNRRISHFVQHSISLGSSLPLGVRSFLFVFFSLTLYTLIGVQDVSAEDPLPPAVQRLQSQLRSLRNTDRALEKKEKWHELLRAFNSLKGKLQSENALAHLLYSRAVLLRVYGERGEDSMILQQAAESFEEVSRHYAEFEIADDALYAAFQIYSQDLHRSRDMERCRRAFITLFPESEYRFLIIENKDASSPSLAGGKRKTKARKEDLVQSGEPRPLVYLDPGHGGEDNGAVGVGGLREKDITLVISKLVQRKLEESGCCRVQLSRESDIFVPLFERTADANESEADLFVSIHSNAHPKGDRGPKGFEIYTVSRNASPEALRLSSQENRAAEMTSSSGLSGFLEELYRRGSTEASTPVARRLYESFASELPRAYEGVVLKRGGVRKGPFFVLFGAQMPAILIELFYVSHPDDAFVLSQPSFRETMADALASAIRRALQEQSS